MIKISIIFILIATIFFIASILPEYSEDYAVLIKTLIYKDFYKAYDDEKLGEIYHVKTFKMPNDSLVEYYWNGNYILKGSIKLSEDCFEEHWRTLYEGFEFKKLAISRLSVGTDSIWVFMLGSEEGHYTRTFIYDAINISVVYLFGNQYVLEDSYNLAVLMAYGENKKYEISEIVPKQM